ncbi:anti-sigma factor [Flavobacterium flavipallidum]|uniref:Anti-sigma factor n=1 Tax=Flavobacterium flavipallidum TaxID=3139140 RepID=A0ABU9HML7_9FLAO
METKEYIESGILELYVYGSLTEDESQEVAAMAKKYPEINEEIIAIEKSILTLSSSFSPFQSAENYAKIKEKLNLKEADVIPMTPKKNWTAVIGWAAAVLLLIGIGFQYSQLEQSNTQLVNANLEKAKIEKERKELALKKAAVENNLAVIKDENNTVVALAGQTVAPESSAKIYWNKETQKVYVDATGLPEPPKGMVYQVWALKLNPLTPTSIGLLDNFDKNEQHFFAVSNTGDAQAFGITLEPAGGSITPTMEQLYTLGKV